MVAAKSMISTLLILGSLFNVFSSATLFPGDYGILDEDDNCSSLKSGKEKNTILETKINNNSNNAEEYATDVKQLEPQKRKIDKAYTFAEKIRFFDGRQAKGKIQKKQVSPKVKKQKSANTVAERIRFFGGGQAKGKIQKKQVSPKVKKQKLAHSLEKKDGSSFQNLTSEKWVFHYTDKKSYDKIIESGEIHPSAVGNHGPGVYVTPLAPYNDDGESLRTQAQILKSNYGCAADDGKANYLIALEKSDLGEMLIDYTLDRNDKAKNQLMMVIKGGNVLLHQTSHVHGKNPAPLGQIGDPMLANIKNSSRLQEYLASQDDSSDEDDDWSDE